ncbi:glycosyl transferase family 41-domain-containing protein [Trichophaea hybrida]|nr:glycosyl transferase family 41-domain-containing protein [Trichophaea hybrida]
MFSNRPLFRTQSTSSLLPTYHIIQENLLRRKTPSGTLPAAYDAAPVEFMTRPTKQLLLPYRGETRSPHPGTGSQGMGLGGWSDKINGSTSDTLRPLGIDASNGGNFFFPTTEWPPQPNEQVSLDDNLDPSVRQFLLQQQQTPFLSDSLWSNSQYSGFQPLYHPITPPTASCDEVNAYLLGYNPTPRDNIWQGQHVAAWESGQSTPSAQLPQAVVNMNLNAHYGNETQDSPSNTWSHQPSQAFGGYLPSPLSMLAQDAPLRPVVYDSMGLFAGGAPLNSNAQPSREKVAAWAHKAYVELLTSIHAQKRQSESLGTASASSVKTGLYPRPPKVTGLKNAFRSHIPTSSAPSRYNSHAVIDSPDRRKRMRASIGGTTSYLDIGTSSSHSTTANGYPFPSQAVPVEHLHLNRRHSSVTGSAGHTYDTEPRNLPLSGSAHVPNSQMNATTHAIMALDALEKMCAESNWTWIDGMLLGGCLSFGLGDPSRSLDWYRHILDIDDRQVFNHVETLSNYAATLLSMNGKKEAERYWKQAVMKRPNYLEAVEHLVGFLCSEHRTQDAVDIINHVETSLRRTDRFAERGLSLSSVSSDGSLVSDIKFDYEDPEHEYVFGGKRYDLAKPSPPVRASNFAIPGSDNGRMLALIHAKGNMLYTLGDNIGAAKAFEDAVLVAAGIQKGGIEALINKILVVLKAASEGVNLAELTPNPPQAPVLLPPDKAIQTARLVFPPDGGLPGLREVPLGAPLKAAVSTTSNSLLSLAKIFQDGMSSGGVAIGRSGSNVKDILALYYLSLSLHASPSTANNVGILLASIQQGSSIPSGPSSHSHHPGTGPGAGVNLALLYYHYGLSLDNKHAHLYTNLGSLLKDINHLPTAIKMYEQAVHCDPSFDIALANLANAVKDQGRISDAIGYYRRAVKSNPEFAEAVCGLANALNSVCDWKGRGGVVRDDGNRDRWHVGDDGTLMDAKAVGAVSSGWMKRVVEIVEKQLIQGEIWGKSALMGDMLDIFLRDIEHAESGNWSDDRHQSLRNTVTKWADRPYEGAKIIRMIERASQRTVWRWYQDRYVKGVSKPLTEYRRPTVPSTLTTPSAPTVLPFHTFTCPLSAEQVRLISERNGLRISCSTLRSSWLAPHVYPPPAPPAPYLRVGYVSSDFNNHPLAHLMQSVFGLHNQDRVKAFCYATTASDNSDHRKQIEAESPVFYDAHSWGPDRLIQQIVDDGIHILINLNGFTRGARNEVFAARPAPIQMSFMGFAGTLGAEWCDYLYADTTAVPPEMLRKTRRNVDVDDTIRSIEDDGDSSWVYAENIIFARYTFFCCDHRQSAPDSKLRRLTWDEEVKRRWTMRKKMFPHLEDDQVILGNFNQLYKIEPTTFRTWLRILAALPRAVLWLLRFPDLGESNLRSLAETWASKEVASRIIFTDVAPKPQHISRAQVCDLFLDTPECNAHTTAADVLWSGTPLLTLPRHKHKMCSRIAASILRAAVPQTIEGKAMANSLVAASEDNYERRAIELVRGLNYKPGGNGECSGELANIRKVLFTNRWHSELFNTKRWVSDLEDAYEEAWRRWVNKEGGDIDLKALKPTMSTSY